MSEKGSKIVNKRFEAMRNQIKSNHQLPRSREITFGMLDTLFEATTDNSSPKTFNQAAFFPNDSSRTMRSLPQKAEKSTRESNPCFEQGKWLKMGTITQKRNFEMMRSNLKGIEKHAFVAIASSLAQIFGRVDRQEHGNPNKESSIEAEIANESNKSANAKIKIACRFCQR